MIGARSQHAASGDLFGPWVGATLLGLVALAGCGQGSSRPGGPLPEPPTDSSLPRPTALGGRPRAASPLSPTEEARSGTGSPSLHAALDRGVAWLRERREGERRQGWRPLREALRRWPGVAQVQVFGPRSGRAAGAPDPGDGVVVLVIQPHPGARSTELPSLSDAQRLGAAHSPVTARFELLLLPAPPAAPRGAQPAPVHTRVGPFEVAPASAPGLRLCLLALCGLAAIACAAALLRRRWPQASHRR